MSIKNVLPHPVPPCRYKEAGAVGANLENMVEETVAEVEEDEDCFALDENMEPSHPPPPEEDEEEEEVEDEVEDEGEDGEITCL